MPWLLLLLAAAVGYYILQAKEFKGHYKIKFIDSVFDYKKTKYSGFTKIFFSIRVSVNNKTDFTGTLQSAKLALSYKGKKVADVSLPEPVTLAKAGETKVAIPVQVSTLSLISNILVLIDAVKNKKAITFNVKGDLNFAIGTVHVNEDFKIKLKDE